MDVPRRALPPRNNRQAPSAVLFVWLWLGLCCAAVAGAGEISGQVKVLNRDDQPLARFDHAVVYIEGIQTPPPPEPAAMDQKDKEFMPRLLAVVKGQEIRFQNSDRIQHNVFSPHETEPFDLGLYPAGEFKSIRLNALRRHKVYCNLHKNMVADILVLPNRFFGLTDEKGHYRIEGLPDGEYVLRVWHIFGGADQKPVKVGAQPLTADFTVRSVQSSQEILEHPNKTGQDYPAGGYETY